MKINLFTSYFESGNEARQAELDLCLRENTNNRLINKIYLTNEGNRRFGRKIKVISKTRPTFSDFFKSINIFSGQEDVNIIANSDIYFNSSLLMLESLYEENTCFALSRSDLIRGELKTWHSPDSQDAWIFFGKIKKDIYGDFLLGKPGCDNRIAYEIQKAGYKIINLCKTITIIHVHCSQIKSYYKGGPDTVSPPYLPLHPHD